MTSVITLFIDANGKLIGDKQPVDIDRGPFVVEQAPITTDRTLLVLDFDELVCLQMLADRDDQILLTGVCELPGRGTRFIAGDAGLASGGNGQLYECYRVSSGPCIHFAPGAWSDRRSNHYVTGTIQYVVGFSKLTRRFSYFVSVPGQRKSSSR